MHVPRSAAVALASLFASLTAAGAQLAVPLSPVPVTLQTLFVLLSGMVLGGRLGALSQALYVLLGLAGLPVFAGGRAGPWVLAGPTGGYLLGFIAGAYVAGRLAEGKPSFNRLVLSGAAGTAAVYVLGVAQLAYWLHGDLGKAIAVGVVPFLPGDAVKVAAAALVARGVKARLEKPAGGWGL